MKVERESLLGTLAVLGLALAVAYLGPDQDHSSSFPLSVNLRCTRVG